MDLATCTYLKLKYCDYEEMIMWAYWINFSDVVIPKYSYLARNYVGFWSSTQIQSTRKRVHNFHNTD